MTFSDALPVQFWLANCETYNEKEVDGVFPRCFCAPFNSTDEITVQFRDTPGYSRSLLVRDDTGEIFYDSPFTEVSSGLYQNSFTHESIDITDDEVQLLIVEPSQSVKLTAPSSWINDSVQTFDSKASTTFTENVSSADTEILVYQPAVVPSGQTIVLTLTVTISNNTISQGGFSILGSLRDGAGVSVSTRTTPDVAVYTPANGTYTQREIITVDEGSTSARLYLRLAASTSPVPNGTADVLISIEVGETIYLPDASILAKSDCLSIKEDHDETILINYHNNRRFASLDSSVGTPDPEFNLRIPAIFSESDDRHPRESESIKLSNNRSLQLMANIGRQRPLKVKPMPTYMHLKTTLALSFQTVTIDGLTWKLDDAYEKDPGNPRHPLKKASAWLTDRNYNQRNVL